jgi:hypothetical protein
MSSEQPPMVDYIVDGRNTRSNVALVCQRLNELGAKGVPVPQQLLDALPHIVARLMKSDSLRVQASGVKLLMAMVKHNLELVAVADKMNRLDTDQPTERIDCPVKLIEGIDPKVFDDEERS